MVFMADALDAITTATVPVNQMVMQCTNASSTLYDAVQVFVQQGTDIVMTGGVNAGTVNMIQYDQNALTTAINQWSISMSTNTLPMNTLTYNMAANTTVTLMNQTSAITTGSNYLLFDTDVVTFGGPARVAATFTTNVAGTLYIPNTFTILTPRELTDEEKAEQARLQAEYEVRMRAEEELRKVANGKAELLLRRALSKEQLRELDEKDYFHVWARDGHKYRICRGWSHNVKRVDLVTGEVKETFCIHPTMQVPVSDNMLAQKLLLEADPEFFFKTAIRSRPIQQANNFLDGIQQVNYNPRGLERLELAQ